MASTFYILMSSLAKKFYVGHTSEPVEERIRNHNSNHNGFTGRYQDWKLVYAESYPTKELAYAREREVAGKAEREFNCLLLVQGIPLRREGRGFEPLSSH